MSVETGIDTDDPTNPPSAVTPLGEGVDLDRPADAGRHILLEQLEDLPEREAAYARAARAANTPRGYRLDWIDFTTGCAHRDAEPVPAAPATLSDYLTALAEAGAKVGNLSRRLSSIKFAHTAAGHPDPATHPRVSAVWEGIRRTHGAPPAQALALMPPLLFDVLDACPRPWTWPIPSSGRGSRQPARAAEVDLTGARDRALLLVGFVAALRRSELAGLDIEDIAAHPNGLVLSSARSKTNQSRTHAELVVLPRAGNPDRCPVLVLQRWLELAVITDGPVFRGVTKANRAGPGAYTPNRSTASSSAPSPAPGLRPTGKAPIAYVPGSSLTPTYAEPAIGPSPTRPGIDPWPHGGYVQVSNAWTDNAATALGLQTPRRHPPPRRRDAGPFGVLKPTSFRRWPGGRA